MANCLVDCTRNQDIRRPIDGYSLAPWIKATFKNGGRTISVGNESLPPDNTAVIKSFEYGNSNGHVCKIEILDQEGGMFNVFMQNMFKDMDKASVSGTLAIQWGWVASNCDGQITIPEAGQSPIVELTVLKIDVEFAEGKIKYILNGSDLIQAAFVARHEKTYGTNENPMSLKDALTQMFNDEEPKMQVKFLRKENGIESEWDFREDVKGTWRSDRQNKAATAMAWMEPYRTDRDLGIHATWDNTNKTPTIILWESPDKNSSFQDKSLGTFIVNGGNCSNVIGFNPSISWIPAFGNMATGGNAGYLSAEGVSSSKEEQPNQTGIQVSVPVPEHAVENYGPNSALKETEKSQNAHLKANKINSTDALPITAELRIQGDPRQEMVDIKLIHGRRVNIIVINPFRIAASGTDCAMWLANPPCNETLTNENWICKGVNHYIREGSYITTLTVYLTTPGIDFPFGQGGIGGTGPTLE